MGSFFSTHHVDNNNNHSNNQNNNNNDNNNSENSIIKTTMTNKNVNEFKQQMKAQLAKFQRTDKEPGSPNLHFDWWMFPLSVSEGQRTSKPEWCLSPAQLEEAREDEEFMTLWLDGVKAVCSSYHFNVITREINGKVAWYDWPIRYYKMMRSCLHLKQEEVYDSLYWFAMNCLSEKQRCGAYLPSDFLKLLPAPSPPSSQ